MQAILGLGKGLPQSRKFRDSDFGDRLNHKYSVSLFLCFAIIVTTTHMVGEKIQCWVPHEFSDEWEKYANSYCWVKNTYILSLDQEIPDKHVRDSDLHALTYYQWVPFIMLCQAFLFQVPYMIWTSFNGRSGADMNSLVITALKLHKAENYHDRTSILDSLTKQMQKFVESREQRMHKFDLSLSYLLSYFFCRQCGRRNGNYLTFLYLGCKLLLVVNAIGQIFLMNVFFGADFHSYGVDYLLRWGSGNEISLRFPRVTMCDITIRHRIGDAENFTFQCVLPINLFHEKLYLIIWIWMVLIAAFNIYSFFGWAGKSRLRIDRHRFIRAHIPIHGRAETRTDTKLRSLLISFTDEYLAQDGVFVLRLIRENTDEIALVDIVSQLWNAYRESNDKSIKMKPSTELTELL